MVIYLTVIIHSEGTYHLGRHGGSIHHSVRPHWNFCEIGVRICYHYHPNPATLIDLWVKELQAFPVLRAFIFISKWTHKRSSDHAFITRTATTHSYLICLSFCNVFICNVSLITNNCCMICKCRNDSDIGLIYVDLMVGSVQTGTLKGRPKFKQKKWHGYTWPNPGDTEWWLGLIYCMALVIINWENPPTCEVTYSNYPWASQASHQTHVQP